MPVPQERHCSEILARTMGVGSKLESSNPVVPSERPGPSRQASKEMLLLKLTMPVLVSDDSGDQENQEPTKLSHPSNPQNTPQSNQQLRSTKAALSSLLPNATFSGSCVSSVNFRLSVAQRPKIIVTVNAWSWLCLFMNCAIVDKFYIFSVLVLKLSK